MSSIVLGISALIHRHLLIKTGVVALVQNSVRKLLVGRVLLLTFALAFLAPGLQAAESKYYFDIPATNLTEGLSLLAQQSNTPLLFSHSEVRKSKGNAVKGRHSVRQALAILLKGSRLTGQLNQNGVLTISQVKTKGVKSMPFKRKSGLATLIAAITSASSGVYAQQQEAGAEQLEEVVVTGIRRSIEESLKIKQNATGFVDAISAEDIGKLPDQNVAEALQRIPGVAIQRSRGEGDFVSIRGLGPDFVRGSVNGRSLLSATIFVDPNINGGITSNTGRAANFDTLPSEIINTLEVIKTPSAKHVEGGIGGSVNLKTARPLTLGDKVAFSAQGLYRDFAEETDPTISGLYSFSNDNESFGALVSVAYSERNIREDFSRTFGYFPIGAGGVTGPFDTDNDGTVDATSLAFPLSNNQESYSESRERFTIAGTLEFVPSESTRVTVDMLHSQRDVESESTNFIFLPFPFPGDFNALNLPVNGDGSRQFGAFADGNVLTTIPTSIRPEAGRDLQQYDDEVSSFAVNVSHDIGDWTLVGDLSYSKAEGDNDFDRVRLNAENSAIGVGTFGYNFTTQVTDSGFVISEGAGSPSLSNPAAYTIGEVDTRRATNEDEEFALQFDASREIGGTVISSIEVGARVRAREKSVTGTRTALTPAAFPGFTGTAQTVGYVNGESNYLDGGVSNSFAYNNLIFPDNAAWRRALGVSGNLADNPFGTFDIEETTYAAYFQANLDGTVGNVPFTGDLGFRVVLTQQDVSGFDAQLTVTDIGGTSTAVQDSFVSGGATAFNSDTNYSNVLPSINLAFEVAENLFVRVAASKTITRPTFNDLSPGLTFNPNCSCDVNGDNFAIAATAGNPGLEPYEATNFDVGVEWYFKEGSALYVGVFNKELESFIADVTNNDVGTLGSSDLRVVGVEQGGSSARINVDQITQPDNQGEADITGVEFGYSHVFDSGFGYNTNLTLVETSAEFEDGGNIDFPGVSDLSYNLTGFYESGPWEARLSYSYRSDYLVVPDGVGGIGSQIFADDYAQLDGSISYQVNDNFTVFLNAVNLTDEEQDLFEAIPNGGNRFNSRSHVGTRFAFGVRGTF